MNVFTSILPIFIIVLTGLALKKLKVADESWIKILNRYALFIAFPALIVSSLISIEVLEYNLAIRNFVIQIVITLVLFFILSLLRFEKEIMNTYLICAMFGNIAYLGYPFITSLNPTKGIEVSIFVASSLVVYFGIILPYLEFSKSKKIGIKSLTRLIQNPLILSIMIGLFLFFLKINVPSWIKGALQMAAGSASPTALVALGIFLAEKFEIDKDMKHVIIITAFKLALLPLIFMFLMKDYNVAIIEIGMPVAVTTFSLAEEYPIKKKVVLYSIILSTILSAVTLPILAHFFTP